MDGQIYSKKKKGSVAVIDEYALLLYEIRNCHGIAVVK
jgi:hypothetical protein